MSGQARGYDQGLLERLNRASLARSFIPQVDIDWDQTTTDAEYESLYSSWSLLEGSDLNGLLDGPARVTIVRYQQMNLMIFTELLERYALTAIVRLYETEHSEPFREYLGHFIKEESYHTTMFARAIAKIGATMPRRKPLPARPARLLLRWTFRLLNSFPSQRVRVGVTFAFLRYAEQISIYAHQAVQSKIGRKESFIRQVWACHALDESRHLVFDSMILERHRLARPLGWIPRYLAVFFAALLSLLLNANEIWAYRQAGAPVHLWQLPGLMWRTEASFKRRVFGLLAAMARGRTIAAGERGGVP